MPPSSAQGRHDAMTPPSPRGPAPRPAACPARPAASSGAKSLVFIGILVLAVAFFAYSATRENAWFAAAFKESSRPPSAAWTPSNPSDEKPRRWQPEKAKEELERALEPRIPEKKKFG